VKFIKDLPEKCVVLVAVQDEASWNLKESGKQALYSIGATKPHSIGFRDSYALIGYKGFGARPSWATDLLNKRGKGPTVIKETIPWGPIKPTFSPNTISPDPGCGKGGPRGSIVGGEEAIPNSWPWMVSLSRFYDGVRHRHFCGGSLVTRYHVITAAHCLKNGRSYQVRLGDHYLVDKTADEQTIAVEKVWRHELFGKKGHRGYDVAVLKLKQPAQLNDKVNTVCLDKIQNFPAGKQCVVTGWGTTKFGGYGSRRLLQVKLPIRTQQDCLKVYRKIGDNEFCAGLDEGGKDSCQGDSGGPFVCQNDKSGKWYLTGVVSWGFECARPGKYGVYCKVSAVYDWIQDKLVR